MTDERTGDHTAEEHHEQAAEPIPATRTVQVKVQFGAREPVTELESPDGAAIDRDIARSVHAAMRQLGSELSVKACEAINEAVSAGDHGAAFRALEDAVRKGALLFAPTAALLSSMMMIAVAQLDRGAARSVYEWRLAVADALKRFDQIERTAQEYLKEFGAEIGAKLRHSAMLALANGAAQSGRRESAVVRYEELLSQLDVSAGTRAWAHRGIALVLGAHSPEGARHEELAADAFLQDRNLNEAVKSQVGLSRALEHREPQRAIAIIDDALRLATGLEVPQRSDATASLHHMRARILYETGEHVRALEEALKAAEVRAGLLGRKAERASSCELAALCAQALGDEAQAKALRERAAAESLAAGDQAWTMRQEVAAVTALEPLPDELLAKVADTDDSELLVMVRLRQAIDSSDRSLPERLDILDAVQQTVSRNPRLERQDLKELLHAAYAELYRGADRKIEALRHYREVLAVNPRHGVARQNTAAILAHLERWSELAEFAHQQATIFGELPGIMLTLGRALRRSGRTDEAAQALYKAQSLLQTQPALLELATAEFKLAMEAGAMPTRAALPSVQPQPARVITRHELEVLLEEFRVFVASQKRMALWRRASDGRGHEWVDAPESQARNLLHAFLKGRLGDLVESFEEVGAGAGRIDLYLRLSGGLAVVVELKMCGGGYSTTYALEGVDQLQHYMENRATGLGFLVVFDGRTRDFGIKVVDQELTKVGVVRTVVVDVRPVVRGA